MLIKIFIFFTVGVEVGGQSVGTRAGQDLRWPDASKTMSNVAPNNYRTTARRTEGDICDAIFGEFHPYLSESTRAVDYLFNDNSDDIPLVDLYKMGRDTVKSEYNLYQLAKEKAALTKINLEKLNNPTFDNETTKYLAAELFRSACVQRNKASITSPKTARGLIEKVCFDQKMF